MAITVNTLNIGDKLYLPAIEAIEQFEISEITKDSSGIKVGTRKYNYELRDSIFNAAISTKVQFKYGSTIKSLFVRIEDAQAEQRNLRITELKRLQGIAHNSLRVLNEFTLKHFTDAKV